MAKHRSLPEVLAVLEFGKRGTQHKDIADKTGVPLNTIRLWLHGRLPERARKFLSDDPYNPNAERLIDLSQLPREEYAYLLGIYLGDGCLSAHPRCYALRISLDTAYPAVVDEVCTAVETVLGRRPKVYFARVSNCATVVSYSKVWPQRFPQHGPGRKHERPIILEPWQRELIELAPQQFLRGLIHSDGCRTVNRFKAKLPSGRVGEYEYPRYFFSNLSADIRGLFCEYCERLGIRWTQSNPRNISVSHRHSVALLDTFIGPKT